jgi:hypothetical protein
MELFTAEGVDPCEVYFSDYADSEGRQLPRTILVRCGDWPSATGVPLFDQTYKVTAYTLGK